MTFNMSIISIDGSSLEIEETLFTQIFTNITAEDCEENIAIKCLDSIFWNNSKISKNHILKKD